MPKSCHGSPTGPRTKSDGWLFWIGIALLAIMSLIVVWRVR